MTKGILALLVSLALVAGGPVAVAQEPVVNAGSRSARAIRAEYAGVLLRSKRYREAASEYRKLVASDRTNVEYRLGLARALAWGGQHRQAEMELRWLAARRPRDRSIAEMLQSARAAFAPTAREAEGWLRENPMHRPYRLALARALVREGRASTALPHYDMLLRSSAEVALLREAAAAHSRARDRSGAARLLGRAVQRAPTDKTLRRDYALALSAAGDRREAIAEYDFLVGAAPTAERLLERGRLHAWMRNDAEAERDITAALALESTADAYVALGDLYRWRAEFGRARESYGRARQLAPSNRLIADRLRELARAERPALASPVGMADEVGWRLMTELVRDNAGFRYQSLRTRAGFSLTRGAILSLGAEQRRVGNEDSSVVEYIDGFGGDVGLTLTGRHGRLSGRVGALRHDGVKDVPFGSVTAAAWWRAWSVALDLSGGPAYPTLSTLNALSPSSIGTTQSSTPLLAHQAALIVAGPLGRVDLAVIADGTRFSDGNERIIVQTHARYALSRRVSAVYGVSDMKFRERSDLYWDPYRYTSHGVGLEYMLGQDRGLAFRARALGGFARSLEPAPTDSIPTPVVIAPTYDAHLSSEGQLSYRGRRWETAIGASYGHGRSDGYQRFGASAHVRIIP